MRELKFRYRFPNNELVTVTLDEINQNREGLYDKEFFQGQYTGLKDKNNKEIYEGDLVKAELKHPNKPSIRICKVICAEAGFSLQIESLYHILHSGELEVIGNIYENKELSNENKSNA